MRTKKNGFLCLFLLLIGTLVFSACSSRMGWGVLLWSTEDPPIPSGTVLPVYIRSNLNKVWVVGLPDGMKSTKDGINKFEIPLAHLELAGSKGKARKKAELFSRYALTYAENMQDRLPIRESPDNAARSVYRLRSGEILKILALAEGSPAISATGDPLPGDWYQVLAEDGTIGYCFSYRLKLFEHASGSLVASVPDMQEDAAAPDPDLDMLLAKKWSPELYHTMVENNKIDLDEMSRNWRFDPGPEIGVARIYVPNVDQSFSYTAIRPEGPHRWRFEGADLTMSMRSETTIAVQFSERGGGMKTMLFVALPTDVDDLIVQENARRDRLYSIIFNQGPVFTSNNYGTIVFNRNGTFEWEGFDLLVPLYISESVEGNGSVTMDLFLDETLEDRYSGAFTMHFKGNGGREVATLRCMYALDNQGFRIEIAPEATIEEGTITRRAASPMVLYFFKDEGLW